MTSRDAPVRWTDPVDALGLESGDGPWDAAPIADAVSPLTASQRGLGVEGLSVPSRNRYEPPTNPGVVVEPHREVTPARDAAAERESVPVELIEPIIDAPLLMGVPVHLMAMAVCAAALFGATSGMIVERLLFGP